MNKQKIAFVGQNPQRFTGNGNFLQVCIDQTDRKKYDVFAFIYGDTPIELIRSPFENSHDIGCPHLFLTGQDWGAQQILLFIEMHEIDQLIFVGIDIWRYANILQNLHNAAKRKKFTWKVIVPYDLPELRKDWLQWFRFPDQVHVYSEFGYDLLKPEIEDLFYFRPMPRYIDALKPASPEEKRELRKKLFPDATDDTLIIGFIGNNQLRKNILRMMKGVSRFVKENKDQHIIFYIHTDTIRGIYDIDQLAGDFGFPDAVIRHNGNSRILFPEEMASICKTFDLYLLPSIQEGLSWTVIEMGLLGIPCAISQSTAHLDYMNNRTTRDLSIMQSDAGSLPLPTSRGVSHIPVSASSPDDIFSVLHEFASTSRKEREAYSKDIREYMLDWCDKCMDISVVLDNVTIKKVRDKTELGEIL